ncbi:MAG: hypothetical protein JNJ41_12570 [Bacteroidia bacterium]|nr:hypothetical protein [Bacteroidia bacterium]
MKLTKLHISLILLFALIFNTCKKYPEGGFVYNRIKHLFGKNKDHSEKLWKLKLYEVNGIDSTTLFQGADKYLNSSHDFVRFHISEAHARNYSTQIFLYNYSVDIDKDAKLMSMGTDLGYYNNDSSQCFLKGNITVCQRNIFNPEKNKFCEWDIRKITKDEVIITKQLTNNYKIILRQ